MQQKNWPQLYAIASTGKIKTWIIWVVESLDKTVTIWTRHGYIDGKLQDKPKIIKTGKNIGKSNETTPYDQACSQAQSTYNKKIDKKYITEIPNGENIPDFILPMLAKNFKKYKHRIEYSAMGQKKLNGVRCMAEKISDTEINFTSRKGKLYNETLEHLENNLLEIMETGQIFDGEIYKHGWTFQQILRRVKKVRPDTNQLEFWVYDLADSDKTMMDRDSILYEAIEYAYNSKTSSIKLVIFDLLETESDVYKFHDQYVKEGFEVIIIRNPLAKYKFDHRSMDLQKFKKFEDKEFKIVGFKAEIVQCEQPDETFIEKEAIIFICENENGNNFSVRPRGSVDQRVKWFLNGSNLINQQLTVRYQERSEDNIPIFPVGITIRDYE